MEFTQTSQFLTQIAASLIDLYCLVLILRVWLQLCRIDFYSPISQFVVKVTQPVLAPLRKIFPIVKNVDVSALVLLFVLGAVKFPIYFFDFSLIGMGLLGVLTLVKSAGVAIFYILFASAILSWFNRGNNPVIYSLFQLTEPLLRPIKRILPTVGMIDFSPMVVVFVLLFLNRFLWDLFGALWGIAG